MKQILFFTIIIIREWNNSNEGHVLRRTFLLSVGGLMLERRIDEKLYIKESKKKIVVCYLLKHTQQLGAISTCNGDIIESFT